MEENLTTKNGVNLTRVEAETHFEKFLDYVKANPGSDDLLFTDWVTNIFEPPEETRDTEAKSNSSYRRSEESVPAKNSNLFERLISSVFNEEKSKAFDCCDELCDSITANSKLSFIDTNSLKSEMSSFIVNALSFKRDQDRDCQKKIEANRDNVVKILDNLDSEIEVRSLFDRVVETIKDNKSYDEVASYALSVGSVIDKATSNDSDLSRRIEAKRRPRGRTPKARTMCDEIKGEMDSEPNFNKNVSNEAHWKNMIASSSGEKNNEVEIPIIESNWKVKEKSKEKVAKKKSSVASATDNIPIIESKWNGKGKSLKKKSVKSKSSFVESLQISDEVATTENDVPIIESKWGRSDSGTEKSSQSSESTTSVISSIIDEMYGNSDKEIETNVQVQEKTSVRDDIKKAINFICKHAKSIEAITDALQSERSTKDITVAFSKVNLLKAGKGDELLENYLCVDSFSHSNEKLEKAKTKINKFLTFLIESQSNPNNTEDVRALFAEVAKNRNDKNEEKIQAFGTASGLALELALAYFAIDAFKNKLTPSMIDSAANDLAISLMKVPHYVDMIAVVYGTFCSSLAAKCDSAEVYRIYNIPSPSGLQNPIFVEARVVRAVALNTVKGRTKAYVEALITRTNKNEASIRAQARKTIAQTIAYFTKKNSLGSSLYLLRLLFFTLLWLKEGLIGEASIEIDRLRDEIQIPPQHRPKTEASMSNICSDMVAKTVNLLSSSGQRGNWSLLLPKAADLPQAAIEHLYNQKGAIESLVHNHLIKNKLKSNHLQTFNGKEVTRLSDSKLSIGGKEVNVSKVQKKFKQDMKENNFVINIHYVNEIL
jgi:hypothetical protein